MKFCDDDSTHMLGIFVSGLLYRVGFLTKSLSNVTSATPEASKEQSRVLLPPEASGIEVSALVWYVYYNYFRLFRIFCSLVSFHP
ncbi:unnamed protein product [Schistosoma margrebowiei]|uniref:Uncharacterized protein n=1 Tax=Schistosoma margrebowiei TaxID=48269 RepID=A0A3P8H5Z9_9TREM|nr:unnamed protein product [Schistosoma margrebowiei]